jgi:hypothetical protein
MNKPAIDECVRLKHDIPERGLHRGETGIVRSTWFSPATAYEVEFAAKGQTCKTRVVLLANQIDVEQNIRSTR